MKNERHIRIHDCNCEKGCQYVVVSVNELYYVERENLKDFLKDIED
jgi:hypothetical protein